MRVCRPPPPPAAAAARAPIHVPSAEPRPRASIVPPSPSCVRGSPPGNFSRKLPQHFCHTATPPRCQSCRRPTPPFGCSVSSGAGRRQRFKQCSGSISRMEFRRTVTSGIETWHRTNGLSGARTAGRLHCPVRCVAEEPGVDTKPALRFMPGAVHPACKFPSRGRTESARRRRCGRPLQVLGRNKRIQLPEKAKSVFRDRQFVSGFQRHPDKQWW